MRNRDVIIYSILFLFCVAFTSHIVISQLTGGSAFKPEKAAFIDKELRVCTDEPAPVRQPIADPQLKAVSEYEKACQSAFFKDMMIFTNMPISNEGAVALADQVATRLKNFSSFGIRPIVIMEPDSEWGLIDFHEYAKGDYDEWIDTYFKRLKDKGITDEQLGFWIPFPEPQQPFWNNNSNPDDFALSINRHFTTLKKYFPAGKTAILLDSQVGASSSASQLVAYTRLVKPSLVDVAGLQGFPWHPREDGDTREPVISASQFVPAYMLEEVAKSLGTKEVLINSGSYRHRKTQNGGEIAVPTQERKAILDSIGYEASLLKDAGYLVTVNIFAENKLNAQEGVDWSYWQPNRPDDSTHAALFTQFAKDLRLNEITISLFDSRN